MKSIQDIIRRPLMTEKSTGLQQSLGVYAFEVDLHANKVEIGAAVEELFNVKVAEVRTAILRGKTKRVGRSIGRRSNWKKAFVKLQDGAQIDFLGTSNEAPEA